MPRQTMPSFKGTKVRKFKGVKTFKRQIQGNDFYVEVHVDKNSQICDIHPRVGGMFDRLHGRPFNYELVNEWLDVYFA